MSTVPLLQPIAKVRKRLLALHTLRFGMLGLTGGAAAGCALAALGRFVPIPYFRVAALGLAAVGLLSGALLAARGRPGYREAASEMDRRGGLDERIGTALAHMQDDTPIVRLQREEAIRFAESFARDAAKHIPVPRYPKLAGGLAALFAVLALLLLLPNPMDDVLRGRQAEKQWIAEKTEQVAEMREQLDTQKLPPLQHDKLERELASLEHDLLGSDTSREALDAMEKSLKKLKEQQEQLLKEQKQAEQWAKEWQANPALQQIGKQLAASNRDGLDSALADLRQQVGRMTPEQKRELAAALDRLAEGAKSPDADAQQQLKEALAGAAEETSAVGGLGENAAKALEEALAQAMEAQAAQMQLAEAAGQLGGQIAQAGLAAAQQLAAQGAAVSPAWGASGIAAGMAAAAGQPPAGGNTASGGGAAPGVAGAGMQPGQGTGTAGGTGAGQGTGGSAGTGSGAGAGGGGQGAGGAGGSGAGPGGGAGVGNGSRSLVTTPRTSAGGGSNPDFDGGPVQGGGGNILQGGSAPAVDGTARPYEDVFKQYEAEATKSLGQSQLPQTMQQLVRDYFTEIQPNR